MKLEPQKNIKNQLKIVAIFSIIYGITFIYIDIIHYLNRVEVEFLYREEVRNSGILSNFLDSFTAETFEIKVFNIAIHIIIVLAGYFLFMNKSISWNLYNLFSIGWLLKFPFFSIFLRINYLSNWIGNIGLPFVLSVLFLFYFNRSKIKRAINCKNKRPQLIISIYSVSIVLILICLSYFIKYSSKIDPIELEANNSVYNQVIPPSLLTKPWSVNQLDTVHKIRQKPISMFDTTHINKLIQTMLNSYKTNKDSLYEISSLGDGIEGGSEDYWYFDSNFVLKYYFSNWFGEGMEFTTICSFSNGKIKALYYSFYELGYYPEITKIYSSNDSISGFKIIKQHNSQDSLTFAMQFLSETEITAQHKYHEDFTAKCMKEIESIVKKKDLELKYNMYYTKTLTDDNDTRSTYHYNFDTLTYKMILNNRAKTLH